MSNRYPGGVVRKNQLVPTTSSASGMWTMDQSAQATKSDIWPYANIAMPISQSLRFKSSSPSKLTRTPGSSSSTLTKITYSGWIKRGTLGTYQSIYGGYIPTGPTNDCIRFNSSDEIDFNIVGGSVGYFNTAMKFRDTSAWYHIVAVVDTTQATARNRMRMWVNGVEINPQSNVLNPAPSQNTTLTGWNNASRIQNVGTDTDGSSFPFDGYMADVYSIDGQALDPSYFGQTSAITGVWEPKQYSGTYGTNGFHLEFKDTTVGKDTSGNNNHWTPNNISTTNDYTNDLVKDVPTQWSPRDGTTSRGNYCVLNAVDQKGTFLAGGNLIYGSTSPGGSGTGNNIGVRSSIGVTTGKWYAEFTKLATTTNGQPPKVGTNDIVLGSYNGYLAYASSSNALPNSNSIDAGIDYTRVIGIKIGSTTAADVDSGYSFTTNDVLAYALDCDSKTLIVYKNGSQIGSTLSWSGTTPSSALHFFISQTSSWNGPCWAANFGQQPFKYTIPSGYKEICTTNLPTPTIGATVATAANKYFDATLYTGNGTGLSSTQTITNGGFQPDFIWIKSRSTADYHNLNDSVRGIVGTGSPTLITNTDGAEQTFTGYGVSALNSNGFNLIGNGSYTNANGTTYVGWQWNAGGSTVTNTTGSISAQVRANPSSGFSIVSYTGNGLANQTIGHGLGVAPSFIIIKERQDNGYNWIVKHTSLGSAYAVFLNTTGAQDNSGTYWGSTSTPTNTVFGVDGASQNLTNQNGKTYIAYCFAPVAGYSAFGSYTGNGSTDGPFVYLGFRPKFVMIKVTSTTSNWFMFDSSRNTYNVVDDYLLANSSAAGATATFLDFTSNGFKLRNAGSGTNGSGDTFIYMAFAENPFKNSLAR